MDEMYIDMIRRLKRILRIVIAAAVLQDVVILALFLLYII